MGTYTMRIQEVVQMLARDVSGWNNKIDHATGEIFDFDYPFYGLTEEEQIVNKKSFEKLFLKHYLMREIGFETYELWQIKLDSKLNLIMPRYIELYKTTLFELDLDNPYHLITTHDQESTDKGNINASGNSVDDNTLETDTTGTNEGNTNNTRTNNLTTTDNATESSSSSSDKLSSDFPNSSFTNGDYATGREQTEQSASGKNDNTRHETGTVTDQYNEKYSNTLNGTEKSNNNRNYSDLTNRDFAGTLDYLHEVKGRTSNKEILDTVEKWRKLIVNINEMIIKELADLFMMLYN